MNKVKTDLICVECGCKMVNEGKNLPDACSACSVPVNQLICNRCNHTWDSRLRIITKHCPACKSPYWNMERKHTLVNKSKARRRDNDV